MGTLPTIPNVIRTTLDWENSNIGRSAHNVLHFESGSFSISTLDTALRAHVTAGMWDWVSDSSSIVTISYLPLDGASGTTTLAAPTSGAWTGGSGSSDCIPQGCGIVKFSTGLKGSAHRGRIFIPHVAEIEQTNGILADVSNVQSAWTTFVAAMAAASCPLVVASYVHADKAVVGAVFAEGRLRTQRRREP